MSQVIVTNDELSAKRASSRKQERAIDTESLMGRWRRNDVTKMDPVERLVGFAVLPILALWGLVTAMIAVTIFILRSIFKGMGSVIGGTRSLITGAATGKPDASPPAKP